MSNLKRILKKAPKGEKKMSARVKRKQHIIKVAANLFSKKSFHDVTVDEIAEKAGVAKGTIYLYFPSKEKLYLGILEETFDSIESLLEQEVEKTDTAPEKLRNVLKIVFRFYRRNLDVLKMFSRDETHLIEDHQKLTENWRKRRVKLYEKIIEKGINEGSFSTTNTKLAALMLYGSVGAVMVFYGLDKDPDEVADEVFSEIVYRRLLLSDNNEIEVN